MKTMSVRHRILGSLGTNLLVMLVIGVFSYFPLATIEKRALAVETHAVPGLYRSSLIKEALAADYMMVVNRFVAIDPKVKQHTTQLAADQQAKLDRLFSDYEQTISTDDDRQAFAQFKSTYHDYRKAGAALSLDGGDVFNVETVSKRIMTDLDPTHDLMSKAIDHVSSLNQEHATTALRKVDGDIRSLLTTMVIGFSLALILALASAQQLLRLIVGPMERLTGLMDTMRQGDFTQRMETGGLKEISAVSDGFNSMADEVMELVGQVQRSGIRVSTSMTEIAATSKQQQATATEVAATTTQIGATSREIAATSKELVRTISAVASVAEHAAGLATSGQAGLAHMEETMGQVMEAASSINAKLAVLNEKAGDINQVVTTITKVADQTNLLSLNAAIEAEKAGEYGRGFAVVSTEIRRLADQTAVATFDIEQMVKEIQAAVSAGVMGMDKFSEEVRRGQNDVHEIGGNLSEIISQVLALVPQFETVSEGMEAQATGAEQISEALVQLTEATQQTVESLRQSSSAIDELSQVSGGLHGSIARFKLVAAA